MKTRDVIAVAGLGILLCSCERQSDQSVQSEKSDLSDSSPPPTTTRTDASEVFKRAFWKRPIETDHILHAERREWADEDGVDRWQWFIAVDPSPEFASYLFEQNPFSLIKSADGAAMPPNRLPEWFPKSTEALEIRQTSDGAMLIITHPNSGRIFATAHGHGFAKAVAMPAAPPMQQAKASGRIPNTPPPKVPKP